MFRSDFRFLNMLQKHSIGTRFSYVTEYIFKLVSFCEGYKLSEIGCV